MNQTSQTPQPVECKKYDDEISLIDLALVLMRRKWLIIGIFIVCAGLGLSYALLMQEEPAYRYTTVVELGRMDDGKPVEEPQDIKNLLEETLIPMFRTEMRDAHDDTAYRPPEVKVEIPSGSKRLIMLNSDSTEIHEDQTVELHTLLLDELKKEHKRLRFIRNAILEREKARIGREFESSEEDIEIKRQSLLNEIDVAEREYDSDMEDVNMRNISLMREINKVEGNVERLAEAKKHLQSQISRLEEEKKQIQLRISEAESRMSVAREQQKKAPSEATDESRAMTLLLIQDQIEKVDIRIANLENRLYLQIPDRQDKLELDLINNEIALQTEQQIIKELQEKIANLDSEGDRIQESFKEQRAELKKKIAYLEAERKRTREFYQEQLDEVDEKLNLMTSTEAKYVGLQSMHPVGGTSKKLILALSLVLGGMLGIFGAFFAEFLSKVRATAREQG